ncbi:MAG: radical SAM protein [Bacillota bacterium]
MTDYEGYLGYSSRVQLCPNVQIIDDPPHSIFFSPCNHRWVKVNADGRRVLESFRDEQVLGEWFAKHVGNNSGDEINARLMHFISTQVTNGILQVDGFTPMVDWKSAIDPPNLQKVYMEVTDLCNLKCHYCYNAWSRQRSQKQQRRRMSESDWYRLVAELSTMGVQEVVITGGEPLLCKWVTDLALHTRQSGIKTTLLTNGTLIDSDLAYQLVGSFDRVNVSLDSSIEVRHDFGRGEGSFRKVIKGINALKQAGHNAIIIKPVLARHNLEGFADLPRFVREELNCFLYTPTLCLPFRAPDGSIDKSFTPELEDILEALDAFSANYERYYPVAERPPVQIGPHVSCGLGKRILSVDSHGDVYPCQSLHEPDLVCGNLFNSGSISDIHNNSDLIRHLAELSVFDVQTCGQCPWALLCSGGCRAFAFRIYNDLKAFNEEFCDVLLESAKRRLVQFARICEMTNITN